MVLSCTHTIAQAQGENSPLKIMVIPHIGGKFLKRSLSIMVQGKFKRDPFISSPGKTRGMTNKQLNSLKKLLFRLMGRYKIPLSQIERHMDHDEGQMCPGDDFPYFEILYSMSKDLMRGRKRKLLDSICREKGIPVPIKDARIVIKKSKFRMYLYSGKVLLKSYSIGMSRRPKGDKQKEGDFKTPAGKFYVCEKYPMRAWMEISYPGKRHANIALKKKRINKNTYKALKRAVAINGVPLHHTGLGQDIGIHAGGFPYGKMRKNSTAGCISMEDPEAFELYHAVLLGAKVEIYE